MPNVGICDMSLYVPKLYLSIESLAKERDLEYAKLNKGLGLEQMRIPDIHEDSATMAANAVYDLIEKNDIQPKDIGRIYLGTESALDGAKPTATYVLEMLRRKYREKYGVHCFLNCDVVDLTFACVGAVDALHNTLDWVRGNENRVGIVVASDFAKYELKSGGEYTQGAGAIAMLVRHNAKLMTIDETVGVATQGVHDFFKPRRTFTKEAIVNEALKLAGNEELSGKNAVNALPHSLDVHGLLDINEEDIQVFKETPVFDGQYSNWTYQNRIREAYHDYCRKVSSSENGENHFENWDRLIFHLPYAYHARRIASELFMISAKKQGNWDDIAKDLSPEPQPENYEDKDTYEAARSKFLRSITKTPQYNEFVSQKLEKSQRAASLTGNMYACSIFLALMSTLESDLKDGSEIMDKTFGFFGYGSGSKSKVFQGKIQSSWKDVASKFEVFKKLSDGQELGYDVYEKIHRRQLKESVQTPHNEFSLDKILDTGVKLGARYYKWNEG